MKAIPCKWLKNGQILDINGRAFRVEDVCEIEGDPDPVKAVILECLEPYEHEKAAMWRHNVHKKDLKYFAAEFAPRLQ